jgi:hypothetical protein
LSCNPVIKEFNINSIDVRDLDPLDSIAKSSLILKNDTLCGFKKWCYFDHQRLSDSVFYISIRSYYDSIFWKDTISSFYLLDTIKINNNISYLIVSYIYDGIKDGFDKRMYLTFFNSDKENIKTYLVSEGVESSASGLIGGATYSKSKLLKNNELRVYSMNSGFIDIGPESYKDSTLTCYDLNNFTLSKIDTIKSIRRKGYIKTIKENGKIKTINLRDK